MIYQRLPAWLTRSFWLHKWSHKLALKLLFNKISVYFCWFFLVPHSNIKRGTTGLHARSTAVSIYVNNLCDNVRCCCYLFLSSLCSTTHWIPAVSLQCFSVPFNSNYTNFKCRERSWNWNDLSIYILGVIITTCDFSHMLKALSGRWNLS